MTIIVKIVCYLWFSRAWGMPYHTGPHGEILGSVKREKELEEMVRACGFHAQEGVRKGKYIFSELWSIGSVLSCWYLALG